MRSGGYIVFHGLDPDHRDYSIGWTIGHDDGIEGESLDSSLANSPNRWFAQGYVDGYKMATNTTYLVEEPEAPTLLKQVRTLIAWGGRISRI